MLKISDKTFLVLAVILASTTSCFKKAPTKDGAVMNPGQVKAGGTLIYARPSDSVGLDPAQQTDGESFLVTDQIFDGLVRFKGETTEVEPALATSWDISPDGLTYTFTIREGVEFHNGKKLTADAVAKSFQRQQKGSQFQYWSGMGLDKSIKSIAALDNKVIFKLNGPDASFLANLAMSFAVVVEPEAALQIQEFNMKPVGTGPFMLKEWKRGEKIVLEKNPKHWDGEAHLNQVEIRVIPESQSRALELKQGNVHIIDSPNPEDISFLEGQPIINVLKKAGMNTVYLAINQDKTALKDVNVRKAINYAINRERIVQLAYGGLAIPAKSFLPPVIWGHNPEAFAYEYSVEKAKALLKEAKSESLKLKLWVQPSRSYNPNSKVMGQLIQEDLRQVGIDAEIVTLEWTSYLAKINSGEHDLAILGWIGDNGDPDNFAFLLSSQAAKKPAQNIAFYRSAEFDKLFYQGKKETTLEARKATYMKLQAKAGEDAAWAPLVHAQTVTILAAKVMDFVRNPTEQRRFHKVWLAQ